METKKYSNKNLFDTLSEAAQIADKTIKELGHKYPELLKLQKEGLISTVDKLRVAYNRMPDDKRKAFADGLADNKGVQDELQAAIKMFTELKPIE